MTPRQKLANQLLDYLAEIPEEKWIRGQLTSRMNPSRCCALGHLGVGNSSSERVMIGLMEDAFLYGDLHRENDDPANLHPKRGACFYLMDVVEGLK